MCKKAFFIILTVLIVQTVSANPGGVGANLSLWLKADAGITGGVNVSAWADQSGNGNDAIQGAGGLQPIINSGGLNFNPIITFDGSDDYFATGSNLGITGQQARNVIVVVTETAGETSIKATIGIDGPSSAGFQFYNFGSGPRNIAFDGSNSSGFSVNGDPSVPSIISLQIYEADADGIDDVELFANGSSLGTSNSYVQIFSGLNKRIGASNNLTGTTPIFLYDGDIAEIIIYNNEANNTGTNLQQHRN